jgi:hypothetical protein
MLELLRSYEELTSPQASPEPSLRDSSLHTPREALR